MPPVPAPDRSASNRTAVRGRDRYRPRKTAALLAQRIVGEITESRLEPGAPLPPEREMLEDYAVARGTLREALRFLEIQGVITMKTGPGGGPVVDRPGSRHLASTMAMMLQLEHTSFRSVLDARVVLEPVLASRAAERITAAELEQLRASLDRMRAGLDDIVAFRDENERFHELIAEAADNPVFHMIISSLTWIVDGTALGVEYPPESRRAVLRAHGRIYRAVAARDPDRAAAAMSSHMADYLSYLAARYPGVIDAPLRWDQVDA
jgi:GntR family transcriptional repressor for pyruvate dehydrogenase complex